MKTFAIVRDIGSTVGSTARDLGANARDFGSTALDFGSHTLDLAWERKKTVLAVVGGVALVAAAGVIISRLLRARAQTPSATDTESADAPQAGKPGQPKVNIAKPQGAGSGSSIAKAAKV